MEKAVCEVCGREFEMSEYEKKLRKCQRCGKTICFNCTCYVGTKTVSLKRDFIDVIRVCKLCKPIVEKEAERAE